MKTVVTYKDGDVIVFSRGPLELDLDTEHAETIFSVYVLDASGKTVFSAYHWHNKPVRMTDVCTEATEQ